MTIQIQALLQTGTKKMEDYFIELMKRNSKVPAPETVLDLLDENNNYDNANIPRIDSSEGPRPVPVAQFEPGVMIEGKADFYTFEILENFFFWK